jgi:hypothetical protein
MDVRKNRIERIESAMSVALSNVENRVARLEDGDLLGFQVIMVRDGKFKAQPLDVFIPPEVVAKGEEDMRSLWEFLAPVHVWDLVVADGPECVVTASMGYVNQDDPALREGPNPDFYSGAQSSISLIATDGEVIRFADAAVTVADTGGLRVARVQRHDDVNEIDSYPLHQLLPVEQAAFSALQKPPVPIPELTREIYTKIQERCQP